MPEVQPAPGDSPPTEAPALPAASATPATPETPEAPDTVDLDAQLDALLARIDQQSTEVATAANAEIVAAGAPTQAVPDSAALAERQPHQPAVAPAAPPAPPVSPAPPLMVQHGVAASSAVEQTAGVQTAIDDADDLASNALAQQIQNLLSDAKVAQERNKTAAAAPATPPPSEVTPPQAQDTLTPAIPSHPVESVEPAQPPEASKPPEAPKVAAPPEPPAAAAAAARPTPAPASAPVEKREAPSPPAPTHSPAAARGDASVVAAEVQQLDSELAAGAEDVIAGEFETRKSAVAAGAEQQGAHASSPEHADADTAHAPAGGESSVHDAKAPHGEQPVSPAKGTAGDAASAGTGGHAATPIGQTPGGRAVARELDEQPELAGKNAKHPAPAGKAPHASGRKPLRFLHSALRSLPTFKRGLALLNWPLLKASTETRNIVGYIGLITLLNGATLLGWRVICGPPKPRPSPPAQVETAADSSSKGEGEGEGHGDSDHKSQHGDQKSEGAKAPAKASSNEE